MFATCTCWVSWACCNCCCSRISCSWIKTCTNLTVLCIYTVSTTISSIPLTILIVINIVTIAITYPVTFITICGCCYCKIKIIRVMNLISVEPREKIPRTWIFSYESVVFTWFSKATVLLRNSIEYTSAKHIHTFKAPSCLADIREFTYSYYILPLLGKVPCTQTQKNHLA